MSDKGIWCLVELQLIWLISARKTKKIGWLDAKASCSSRHELSAHA